METWKQELANFLKLLGALLVAGVGGRLLAIEGSGAWGWGWYLLPKVLGHVLLVLGAGAAAFHVLRRLLLSVRISVGSPSETVPAPPSRPAGKDKKKK